MNLLVKFTKYQDYVSGQLAETEIDESSAEAMLDLAKAKSLSKGWSKDSNSRVAVQKAEAQSNPEVIRLTESHAMFKARRKLLTIMADSMARDAAVVSREISRRIGRDGPERRVDRFTP